MLSVDILRPLSLVFPSVGVSVGGASDMGDRVSMVGRFEGFSCEDKTSSSLLVAGRFLPCRGTPYC